MLHYSTSDDLRVAAQSLTPGLRLKYVVCEHEELQVTASVRESICRVNIAYACLFMEVKKKLKYGLYNEAPRQSVSPFSVAEVKQHCNSCAPTNTFFPWWMDTGQEIVEGSQQTNMHHCIHFTRGFESPRRGMTSLSRGSPEQIRSL